MIIIGEEQQLHHEERDLLEVEPGDRTVERGREEEEQQDQHFLSAESHIESEESADRRGESEPEQVPDLQTPSQLTRLLT